MRFLATGSFYILPLRLTRLTHCSCGYFGSTRLQMQARCLNYPTSPWYGLRTSRLLIATACVLRTLLRSPSFAKCGRTRLTRLARLGAPTTVFVVLSCQCSTHCQLSHRLPYIKFCFKNFIHGVRKLLFEYNGMAKLISTFGLFFNK